MKGYNLIRDQNSLEGVSIFKTLNIIALVADLILIGYLGTGGADIIAFVLPFHLLILVPSGLYQLYPGIRSNETFRSFSYFISWLFIIGIFVNIFLGNQQGTSVSALLYLFLFLFFTLPGAIVSITLLLVLALGNNENKEQVLMAPQQYYMTPQQHLSSKEPMV
mmetsp:Transcript_25817/g.22884  ORF Transcript_25817/g.22884 Transcript_25817/m.22884 type:complete len:164 (-) Transcript_25817:124-615(-)